MTIDKPVNLGQLAQELDGAGFPEAALGTSSDPTKPPFELHTYDAKGVAKEVPEGWKTVITAHVAEPVMTPLQSTRLALEEALAADVEAGRLSAETRTALLDFAASIAPA